MKEVTISDRKVGLNNPCFVIAEIGSNHNNDWQLAIKHIDEAANAGADAVKFQTFNASNHVSSFAKTSCDNKTVSVQEILKNLELDREWHKPLYDHCKKKGIIFLSSPCDFEAVNQLEYVGVGAHKISSFDIPDLELVRHIARTGKPVIMSTGMANWMEIQRAVDECRNVGNNKIILLQCTSLYPAPVNLSNLHAMNSMRSAFNVLTGYSDHTEGDVVACASVAMGACLIEKHFTLDRSLPGPDHHFAIEPNELKEMINRIRIIESALGDGEKKGPREEEIDVAIRSKRSIHASVDISSGSIISSDMLLIKRPGFGVSPHLKSRVVGRKANRNIVADEWISWDMLV